jgi:hypothetical protein
VPVNAKFVADFSSFTKAVEDAKVTLGSMEANANKVGKSLNAMVDNFSGRKVIQDAVLMTKAVEDVGGASTLTAKEMAKVNGVVSEAIDKYKALGQSAPKSMTDLADATKTTSSWTASFGQELLTTAAGFVTAQAIISTFTGIVKGLGNEFVTLTIHGATVADVSENFERLATQAGHVGETMLGVLRQGTHSTIDDFALMKSVNTDLAAGMNLTDDQFGLLAKGAFALAQATGTNVKEALDTMNDAMLTGRTRAVALLTGKIDLEAAENRYATSLGTSRQALTDEQKLEAARAAILDAVSAATGRLGEQLDGLDEFVDQARTAWVNFEDKLGEAIATSEVLMTGLRGVKDILTDAFSGTQEALIQAIVDQVNNLSIALIDLAITGVRTSSDIANNWKDIKFLFDNIQQVLDFSNLSALNFGVSLRSALHLPPVSADSLKQIDALTKSMDERAKSLAVQAKAQDTTTASADALVGKLEALKDKMVAAGVATNGFVGPLQAATRAAGLAGGAHADLTKGLHEANDAIGLVMGNTEEETRKLIEVQGATDTWGMGIGQLNDRVPDLTQHIADQVQAFADLADEVVPLITAFDDYDREMRAAKDAADALQKTHTALANTMGPVVKGIDDMNHRTPEAVDHTKAFSDALRGLTQDFALLAQIAGPGMDSVTRAIGSTVASVNLLFESQKKLKEFADAWKELSTGQKVEVAGLAASNVILEHTSEGVSRGMNALRGAAKGAQIGAIAGPWGMAVGAAAGAIYGAFQSAEKAINKTRAAYVDSAGGLDMLRDKATAAGTTINALLDAKNVKQYEKAVKDLNDAFESTQKQMAAIGTLQGVIDQAGGALSSSMRDTIRDLAKIPGLSNDAKEALLKMANDTQPDFQKLIDMAQGYGIDLANLGPTFQQADLSAKAAQIIGDFEKLRDAGADVGGVINGMADEIQGVVDESLKFNTEIPENMRGMIQALIDSNQLFDDQGQLITDISKLKFGAPVETEADKIVKAIEALGDILKGLPDIAEKAAQGMTDGLGNVRPPTIHVPVVLDWPSVPDSVPGGATGGLVTSSGIQAFARGGRVLPFRPRGTDTVPAMLTPGEGVLSVPEMHALGGVSGFKALRESLKRGGGSNWQGENLANELKAMRAEFLADRLTRDQKLARAVRDEVQKARVGRR